MVDVLTRNEPTRGELTRRERQRLATYDEIVEVSRRLLGEGSEVSLRAVATAMGMTPPALYRYIDSHAALLDLIRRAIFIDVVAEMAVERDRFGDDDPIAQVVVAASAFRRWALAHPAEYRLLFAWADQAPPAAGEGGGTGADAAYASLDGEASFSAFFGEIFARLCQVVQFPIPSDAELDPAVLDGFACSNARDAAVCNKLPGATPGMLWLFERAWARLYGAVTLEVFGKVHSGLIGSGAIFLATMRDIGGDLGLADQWGRVEPLIRETLAAQPAAR